LVLKRGGGGAAEPAKRVLHNALKQWRLKLYSSRHFRDESSDNGRPLALTAQPAWYHKLSVTVLLVLHLLSFTFKLHCPMHRWFLCTLKVALTQNGRTKIWSHKRTYRYKK
jgi:hypothetical protein